MSNKLDALFPAPNKAAAPAREKAGEEGPAVMVGSTPVQFWIHKDRKGDRPYKFKLGGNLVSYQHAACLTGAVRQAWVVSGVAGGFLPPAYLDACDALTETETRVLRTHVPDVPLPAPAPAPAVTLPAPGSATPSTVRARRSRGTVTL